MMIKLVKLTALVIALSLGVAGNAAAEKAPSGELAQLFSKINANDFALGEPAAKVEIVEYVSMTCPHCAKQHDESFEQIKEQYIDTGKIRYALRDLPWDNLALAAAKVARCSGEDMFYTFASAFLKLQTEWAQGADPLGGIKKIARMGGMSAAKVESCIEDDKLQKSITESRRVALEELKVQGTPVMFINGKKIEGYRPFSELQMAIETALSNAR